MKTRCKKAGFHGLALLLTLVSAGLGYGQAPEGPQLAPPRPTAGPEELPQPRQASADPLAQPLWKLDPLGQGATLGLPCAQYQDHNGPLLIGDPLLDDPPGAPGWVAGVEVGIVVPHIENRLFSSVTLASGATNTVHLPTAPLGVNAMPKVELGYNFGQATGAVLLSYRSLAADGNEFVSPLELPIFAPTGAQLRSRLDLQVVDLDYASHEPRTMCGVDMKWRAGLRGLNSYSDSQATNGAAYEQTTNRYWGLGPHAGVDFRHGIGGTGLELFGRLEGAIVFGHLVQRYTETTTAADGTIDAGETRLFINSEVTMVAFQAGVSWRPPWNHYFHVTAGYGYEHFFDLGSIGVPVSAREQLTIQGGFLRAEWRY
jgi:hypothetical protein